MGFIIPRTQTNGDYWDLMGYHGIANNLPWHALVLRLEGTMGRGKMPLVPKTSGYHLPTYLSLNNGFEKP